MSHDDPRIEAYLDELHHRLRWRPVDSRRVVLEIESHLRDTDDAGATVDEAIARVGSPRQIAAHYRPTASIVTSITFFLAVGLLAIGLSGVLSMSMRAEWGDRFVAGDTNGVTYTAARCADFERFHPEQPTCEAAATAHHADEVALYRIFAGVLGLGALGAWLVLRRRSRLPRPLIAAVGASTFGLAGLVLAEQSVAYGTTSGAGQWLSGSIVSLVVAAVFARSLVRELKPA
jgi:hypothetical protein